MLLLDDVVGDWFANCDIRAEKGPLEGGAGGGGGANGGIAPGNDGGIGIEGDGPII